jgi:hypothetical protein
LQDGCRRSGTSGFPHLEHVLTLGSAPRRGVAPWDEHAGVGQLEQSFRSRRFEQIANGLSPDFDALLERARLSDARDDDDGGHGFAVEEILVLREEEQGAVLEMLPDSYIGGTTPSESDDVIGGQTIGV